MNTIDFDATVDFVWDWVAQFNTYLAQMGWITDIKNPSSTRGLNSSTLDEIADHLFKMILKTQHPHRVMRALGIHLQSLVNNKRNIALPEVYVEVNTNSNGVVQNYMWNTNNFCTTLEKDVNRIVSKFEEFHTLGEQHFANAVKHLSTEEKKNKM